MPLLSLVTGTYNRPESLSRLVTSIRRYTQVNYELLIGDADGKASDWHMPYDSNGSIRVIRDGPPDDPKPMGHTRSYNRLFSMCRGHWVLWLNDDAEVEPNYDVKAIEFMEHHPSIGLGCLYYKEYRVDRFTEYHINRYRGMLYANFGILTKAWGDKLGWFDEDFPMYGADNSLAFRNLLAGKGIAGISEARLIHHSPQDDVRAANQHLRGVASALFQSKYGPLMNQMQQTFNETALPEDQPKVVLRTQPRQMHRRTPRPRP